MFNFEKLDVWHDSIKFADLIYSITHHFPNEEQFGLKIQMRRAAVSVSSNIAEGSSRFSKRDFSRFIEIATGSIFEVVSQSLIAKRRGFLNDSDYSNLCQTAEKLGKMLSRLRQTLLKKNPSTINHPLSTVQ